MKKHLIPPLLVALCVAAQFPARAQTVPAGSPPDRPPTARALAPILLWPSGAPGALGSAPTDQPIITPYLPPEGRANGTAVVIFPGGGYQNLSMVREGSDIANWLAGTGVTAFVVRYRLGPAYHHPAMLHDAQRAIRIVRARAAEWQLDPHRVGIIGFSAGGHLVSSAGTHFDAGAPASNDPIERQSSRPDFMMLLYPVITMRGDSTTHRGSRVNLLGATPSDSLVRFMSSETQVTRDTPPTFIAHATNDRTVPVENALMMYQALRNAGVQTEMHIFEYGGHGFSLAQGDPVLGRWTALCENWMRRHGWLKD